MEIESMEVKPATKNEAATRASKLQAYTCSDGKEPAMKLTIDVPLFLLLSCAALAAQSANRNQNIVIQLPPPTGTCPVFMRAQHAADGDLLAVNSSHPKGIGQSLHLTVTSSDSRRIASATVTVRGLVPKGRVTQTLASQDDAFDAEKTMDIKFSAEPGKDASGDIWVPGLSAVMTIDLQSVTFTDGSTWKLPAERTCRTFPDPVMLISGR
jgi:hypothetical protein